MEVGVPLEFFAEGLAPEVELAVRTAIIQMQALKAEIKEISLPMTKYAIAAYYLIATAEASSNLARYDGVKYGYRAPKEKGLLEMYMKTRQEGFGAEVKRRIMLGTYALSAGYYDAYYGKAQAVRTLIKRDFDEAFKEVDVIVTPTMPTPAFKLGEKIQDPLQMYLSDIYTISVNLTGLPAISLPCGLSSGKLPIGLQIIGRPFEEEKVLRAAYAYEEAARAAYNINQVASEMREGAARARLLGEAIGEIGQTINHVHGAVRGGASSLLTNLSSLLAGFRAAYGVFRHKASSSHHQEGGSSNGG